MLRHDLKVVCSSEDEKGVLYGSSEERKNMMGVCSLVTLMEVKCGER